MKLNLGVKRYSEKIYWWIFETINQWTPILKNLTTKQDTFLRDFLLNLWEESLILENYNVFAPLVIFSVSVFQDFDDIYPISAVTKFDLKSTFPYSEKGSQIYIYILKMNRTEQSRIFLKINKMFHLLKL